MSGNRSGPEMIRGEDVAIPFLSLPLDPEGPPGNAWGRFGPDDQLGTLNLLTPATVAAASREITSGVRISLDWPLDTPKYPGYGRQKFKHEIKQRGSEGTACNDDVLTFNTQSSTQWDGFRHFGYLKEKRFYNGTHPEHLHSSSVLGTDAWASSGGIVGRGVLLDYGSWASRHNIGLEHFRATNIPFSHIQNVIEDQKVTFRPGDILLIRTGFTTAFEALPASQQQDLSQRHRFDFMGVEPTVDILRWLWESQFAAVAGDSPSFERSPVCEGMTENDPPPEVSLHQWLLAGWGMPIGEMFDLDKLAQHCRETGRWSFFFSSVPLKVSTWHIAKLGHGYLWLDKSITLLMHGVHQLTWFKVPGGVASPPNAIAIF